MYLEGWSIHPSNSLKELHIDYQSSQCQTEIRIQYPESDNGTFGYFAIKRKRSFRFHTFMDFFPVIRICFSNKDFSSSINLLRYSVRIDLSSSLSLTFITVFSA